jgi:hypothetical protein
MLFTSNNSLKASAARRGDELGGANIDRALNREWLIRLEEPSIGALQVDLDEAIKDGSNSGGGWIGLPGNHCPDFAEPK